ncbi:hypothetical protein DMUE_3205 [Dictyocoela muelleri]|nr:hypothetical protein DMUE_3205 [Dictyocoela muelleri]
MVDFIYNELKQLGQHERKYIVMNNAFIHKTAEVREALALKNYILMFLPRYSPQLNSLEEFFSCLKVRVREISRSTTSSMLIDLIRDVVINDEFRIMGYFDHMRMWLQQAMVNAEFI